MVFSSYSFIVFFIVAYMGCVLTRRLLGVNGCKIWLVVASLFFYTWGNPDYLPLLMGTVVFNYLAAVLLSKLEERTLTRRCVFIAAVLGNLSLLFFFKYTNFFIENINSVFRLGFSTLNIKLPLGISFYTFQLLAYIAGVYSQKIQKGSFLDFAAAVTFFPQLIVGPIIRFEDMERQLRDREFLSPDAGNISSGLMLFSIGCAKKVLIADALISHAQGFYDTAFTHGHFFSAWLGVIAYTFAYYFDFSGYVDMALGLGRFFNIQLPKNFDSPYKAKSFADYWRRWNITVTQFFNDFIFKSIFKFGDRTGKFIIAVIVTFLVSGIWHGAGWHYIFWGLANGILVSISNILALRRIKLPPFPGWLLTFFLILLTRVLFDCSNMTQAVYVYRLMFDLRPAVWDTAGFFGVGAAFLRENIKVLALLIVSGYICFFCRNTGELLQDYESKWQFAAFCGATLTASLFFMGGVSNFLYFQF